MSYHLDKKAQRKKYTYIAASVAVLFILFFFRSGIWNGLAVLSHGVFRPVLIVGDNIGVKFKSLGAYFSAKKTLYLENENLKSKLAEDEAKMSNYNSILSENTSLKETLARGGEGAPMILSAILGKPNQSPYDTLVIDAGAKQGLKTGEKVFALGNIPIGRIADVYQNSSKVILFSNSGEKTQAVVSGRDIFVELVGRGGNNFEMILPRDFTPTKGDEVVLPGINPYVLGIVETIISDPRDPFIKALLVSPVNIQHLKFVQVLKN
jgi:cell shape-determining protein MreC